MRSEGAYSRSCGVPHRPLTVQFWLLGFDAREGDLGRRGFTRTPAPQGSSVYTLGPLALHSAGMTLDLRGGALHFARRTGRFSLNGGVLPAARGLELCRPFLLDHEAWVACRRGTEHRSRQLSAQHLPPPVRRSVPVWEDYLGPGRALDAHLRTVARAGRGPAHLPPWQGFRAPL